MATNAEKAMTNILLDKFNKSMKPVQMASKAKASQFSGIKESITNINPLEFTPLAAMQLTTDTALNDAFESTAWLSAGDALDKIQSIQSKCGYLEKMGITQAIDKMAGGLMSEASNAATAAIDAAKAATGLSMPEFGIGKQLSDLVSKGVTATEPVRKELEGTVSAILETGKGVGARASELVSQLGGAVGEAVGLAAKGLSTLGTPLQDLDALINCVDEIGGGDYVTEADEMIDSLNQVYDELGVEDDPNQENFGEFNSDKFFDSMPTITSDQKDNMLKATNMNDKSKNNSEAAIGAAKKKAAESEASESSLSGDEGDTVTTKKQETETRAKVEFVSSPAPAIPAEPDKPAIPAKTQKVVEILPGVVQYQPIATPPTKAQPAGVSYRSLLVIPVMINEGDMTEYLAIDPGKLGYPLMLSAMQNIMVPTGYTTTDTTDKKIALALTVTGAQWTTLEETVDTDDGKRDNKWPKLVVQCIVYAQRDPLPFDSGLQQIGTYTWEGGKLEADDYEFPSAKGQQRITPKAVRSGFRIMEWTAEQFESLLT